MPLASIAWIRRLNMGGLRNDTSSYHQSIVDPMPFQSASRLAASEAKALDASEVMQRETRCRSSAVGSTPSQVSSAC
jgi:nanoRNase/pAp phosphatase (c-di-AMP/oligoRNAs hydrolase)